MLEQHFRVLLPYSGRYFEKKKKKNQHTKLHHRERNLIFEWKLQYTLNEVSEEELKVVVAAGSELGLANFLVHLKAEGHHHYVQNFHQ